MPSLKSLSLRVQKLNQMLKLTIPVDRPTNTDTLSD